MKIKSIISGMLVACLVAAQLPQFIQASADSVDLLDIGEWIKPEMIDYESFSYDSWDGTYKFDWYDETADSYIINSASDLAGLVLMTGDFSDTVTELPPEQAEDEKYISSITDFGGKCITLDCDIDLSDFELCMPNFSGTLDLNDHALKISNTIITEIAEKGIAQNGYLIGCLKDKDDKSTHYLITTNNGELSDLAVGYEVSPLVDTTSNYFIALVSTNNSTIKNVSVYCGLLQSALLCGKNETDGVIESSNVVLDAQPEVEDAVPGAMRQLFSSNPVIGANSGTLLNMQLLSEERDSARGNSNHGFFLISANSGTIDSLTAKGFTTYTNWSFAFIDNTLTGSIIQNADVALTMDSTSTSENRDSNSFIVNNTKGVIENCEFNCNLAPSSKGWISTYTAIPKAVVYNNGSITPSADMMSAKDTYSIKKCIIHLNFLDRKHQPVANPEIAAYYIQNTEIILNNYSNRIGNAGSMSTGFCCGVFDNCSFDVDYLNPVTSRTIGTIAYENMLLYNSDFHVGTLNAKKVLGSPFAYVLNSKLTIDKLIDLTSSYGLVSQWIENSYVDVKAMTGGCNIVYLAGVRNTYTHLNYSGEIYADKAYGDMASNDCISGSYGVLYDSAMIITFDKDCSGTLPPLFSTIGSSMHQGIITKNSLVYIGAMPTKVYLPSDSLSVLAGDYDYSYPTWMDMPDNHSCTDLILVAPGVNVKSEYLTENTFSLLDSRIASTSTNVANLCDCYIYANIYCDNPSSINGISVTARGASLVSDRTDRNTFAEINVFDSSGKAVNIPVYFNYTANGPEFKSMYDVVLKTNSTSSDTALQCNVFSSTNYIFYYALDRSPIVVENCGLLLENEATHANVLTVNDRTDLAEAKAILSALILSGAVSVKNFYANSKNHAATIYTSSNEPLKDTYSVLEYIRANDTSFSSAKAYLESHPEIQLTSEDDISLDFNESYRKADESTGLWAYGLDNGSTPNLRQYNYTVGTDDVYIQDPTTGEKLYAFPKITLNRNIFPDSFTSEIAPAVLDSDETRSIFERSFNAEMNVNPVFKITTDYDDNGHIELSGLDNTTALVDDSYVYIKSGIKPVSDIISDNRKHVFNSATITGAVSGATVLSDFDEEYTMPNEDIILKPNFKTLYDITVEIEPTGTKTVVTPSALEAFENDEITVDIKLDEGYTLNSLTYNDIDFTDGFTMPASNAVIKLTLDAKEFNVSCEVATGAETGTLTASQEIATVGEKISLTATPADDYKLSKLYYIIDGTDTQVSISGSSFTMPADNVTVTAEFTAKEKTKPTDPTPPTPSTPSGPTPRPDLRIVKYVLLGEEGVIDEDDHTITVDIPLSKRPDDERATPDEVVKTRGDLTPSEDDSIPLDETVVYVLEDPETGTVKRYTMNINWIDDTPDLRIVKYVLLGETGIIDDEKHTITVNIPLSKRPDDMRAVPDEVVYTAGILTPTADDAISLSSNVIYLLSYPATRATTTYLMTVNWIDDTPTPPDTPDEGNTPGDDGGDNGGNTPGDDGGDDDGGDDGDPGDKNPNTGASNTNLIFIALLACATITTFSSPRKERT